MFLTPLVPDSSDPGRSGRPEFSDPLRRFSAGTIVMLLFVAGLSLSMLAVLAAYFWFAIQEPDSWPPPGTPNLPRSLWFSTALMIVSTLALRTAIRGARADRQDVLRAGVTIAILAAVGFLISQSLNLFAVLALEIPPQLNKFVMFFYLLVGLHALHLVGGLVPLGFVGAHAYAGRYTSRSHAGLRWCAIYWYFLDAVWLVMFALLLFAQR